MKNALIWIVICVFIIFLTGLTPRTEKFWLIVETCAVLFWSLVGLFMFARGLYRLFVAMPRGH
jgi:hypothetical protein